jgi:hypothetical protein
MNEPSNADAMILPDTLQDRVSEPGPVTEGPVNETTAMITETMVIYRDMIIITYPDTPFPDHLLYPCTTYESYFLQRWLNLNIHPDECTALMNLCINCPETDETQNGVDLEVALDALAGMNFCLAQLDGSAQVTAMRLIGVAPKLVTSECNRVLRCSYPLPG